MPSYGNSHTSRTPAGRSEAHSLPHRCCSRLLDGSSSSPSSRSSSLGRPPPPAARLHPHRAGARLREAHERPAGGCGAAARAGRPDPAEQTSACARSRPSRSARPTCSGQPAASTLKPHSPRRDLAPVDARARRGTTVTALRVHGAMSQTQLSEPGHGPAVVPKVGARPLFLLSAGEGGEMSSIQAEIEARLADERAGRRGAARGGRRRRHRAPLHRPSRRRHARALRARHARTCAERPRALRARGLLARHRAPADQARPLPPLPRPPRARAHARRARRPPAVHRRARRRLATPR